MNRKILVAAGIIMIVGGLFFWSMPVRAANPAQLPTSSIATVTSTPAGAVITVKMDQEFVNVRSGPATIYPKVGLLLPGQQAPAKGRSAGGEWILIVYPGVEGGQAWIYAPLVDISPGSELGVIAPPPTPTPMYSPTIDPTLAAQFVVTAIPTRLPTFTPPPPLVIPTFQAETNTSTTGQIPMGLVIIGLFATGTLMGVISLAQGR